MSLILPGQHVLTVSGFLVKRSSTNRVLLRKHPKLGQWIQPGGHVEPHQDPITALISEYKDETEIDLTPLLRTRSDDGRVRVLTPPSHLTVIRIPAGKPNPEDPEHFMVDMGYLLYTSDTIHMSCRAGDDLAWIGRSQLDEYDMPLDINEFLKWNL